MYEEAVTKEVLAINEKLSKLNAPKRIRVYSNSNIYYIAGTNAITGQSYGYFYSSKNIRDIYNKVRELWNGIELFYISKWEE